MNAELVQYLIGAGIVAAIGLLLRLDRKLAFQNGSLARVVKEFEEHKSHNREDFRRVWDKIDELREAAR